MTMEPFDGRDALRPGADLSGARLDRLRNRPVARQPHPSRSLFAWVLVAILLAFALGLIANPWFERSVRSHLPGFAPTVAPTVGDLAALDARVAALEARPRAVAGGPAEAVPGGEQIGRIEGTLATLSATIPAANARTDRIATDLAALTARIDSNAAATTAALTSATANAERAQAMLVVGAVRRQLMSGARLGVLEPALRRSFGVRANTPVEAVAALGAAPVTLASLHAGLDQLRPDLGATAVPALRGWWEGFRDSIAGIVVRPAASVANDPSARIDRAAAALAANNVAAAVAEVAALPAAPRAKAQAWLTAADRYQAGWRGIAALEALLIDPLPPVPALAATTAG